ncbi:MAG TPA: hypothetical protein VGL89_15715 [Candidatus Koribacter sp.]
MRDPFDYFGGVLGIALGIVFAVIFYRIGEIDYEKGYITALASIAVSLAFCFAMKMGALGVIIGQVLLYGVLWIYNAQRDAR